MPAYGSPPPHRAEENDHGPVRPGERGTRRIGEDGTVTHAQRVLVLGGISSGKSEFAERLLVGELAADAARLHHLAIRPAGSDGADGADGADRTVADRVQPDTRWHRLDCGSEESLISALAAVPADDAALVDDLGDWVATALADTGGSDAGRGPADRIAAAVRDCPARSLVVVSPQAGLSGTNDRRFAGLLGTCNQALAAVCDAVALVVAGRVVWLPARDATPAVYAAVGSRPGTAGDSGQSGAPAGTAEPAGTAVPTTGALPTAGALEDGATAAPVAPATEPVDIGPAEPDADIMAIHPPDRIAINAARDRLRILATGGTGLGALAEPVAWAAGSAGTAAPWASIRVVLVGVDHDGGAAAGDVPASDRLADVRAGTAPLARLAERVGAAVTVADLAEIDLGGPAPAMELTDVLSADQADRAFALGRELADRAADEGVQLLVPATCGAGVQAVAAAVLATATGSEPAGLLGRVIGSAEALDDDAWIARCVAARDALHRIRLRSRDARSLLAMVGGADLAALTGLLVGAAVRQLPVLVDNPAAATAMVLARDLAPSSPWWCQVPDHGRHPAVRLVCDLLGMEPFLDLGLGLGDGSTALTAVGLLRSGLTLAAALDEEAPDPVTAGAGGN